MKKLLFIIITLLLAGNVYAIGLSPARVSLNFEPNIVKEMTFTIVNTIDSEIKAEISVEGELSPYLTFESTLVPLAPGEHKKVKAALSFPEQIKGGDNVLIVRITEIRKATSMINVRAEVIGKIFIKAVYEGYYAEPRLIIKSSDVNEKVKFELEIANYGKENITQASAFINLLDQNENKIATIDTNNLDEVIRSHEKATLYAEWMPDVNAGLYKAKATVIYHDKTAAAEQEFRIGELFVDIINLPESIIANKINEINIEIENTWSNTISNIYADIIVKKDGNTIAASKTLSENVNAREKKTIKGYVDTSNLVAGEYDLEVLLHYEGKTTSKTSKLKIIVEEIEEKESKLLVPLIIMVVLLAIVSAYLLLRKKR